MRKLINPPEGETPPMVARILNAIKPALVYGMKKALQTLPQDCIVDSFGKCDNSEMKRQWLAIVRARERWQDEYGIGRPSGPEKTSQDECLDIFMQAYFTVQKHESNYQILSALMLDEYMKIRRNNEKV